MDTTVIDYQQIYEKFDLDKTSSEDDMYGLNSTMEPAIKIENCNFGYNGEESSLPVRILSRVNLKIGHGDFIGIVGAVGSGKARVYFRRIDSFRGIGVFLIFVKFYTVKNPIWLLQFWLHLV